MRNLILAASAATLAVPVTFALPTDQAEAQRRYYRDGYYNGPTSGWDRDYGIYIERLGTSSSNTLMRP